MFKLRLSSSATVLIFATLSACATSTGLDIASSEHLIIGPKGYTVDWGLPKAESYWVPEENKGYIKSASESCNASPNVFVWHHIPRPPWFSYLGFNFPNGATEQQKSCVVRRLKAVQALTVYLKRK